MTAFAAAPPWTELVCVGDAAMDKAQHSHMSSIYQINTAGDSDGSNLNTFIRDVTTR